jgi:RNA polymerase-binding transcription factor DksA
VTDDQMSAAPDTGEAPAADTEPEPTEAPDTAPDLDAIEHDLAGVEQALTRLADGTYWVDEVTGETIADDVLLGDPIARRAPDASN